MYKETFIIRIVLFSESLIEKRSSIIDLSADRPHELEIKHIYRHTPGFFPQLDSDILNKEPVTNK